MSRAGVSDPSTQPSGASAGPSRPEAQRPQPGGVAHPHQVGGVDEDEGEGPLEHGEDLAQGVLEGVVGGVEPRTDAGGDIEAPVAVVVAVGRSAVPRGGGREPQGQELGHEVAVGGDHAGEHAGLLGQGGGVGQVAVVAEGEPGPAHGPEHGLGVAPLRGTGGRVAGVADGEGAGEARDGALVEDGGDQAHVPHDGDGLAVADGHAGGLLAPVLQGEHAVEGELGDGLARRVHAEDTAGFFHWALIALPSLRRTFRGSRSPGASSRRVDEPTFPHRRDSSPHPAESCSARSSRRAPGPRARCRGPGPR